MLLSFRHCTLRPLRAAICRVENCAVGTANPNGVTQGMNRQEISRRWDRNRLPLTVTHGREETPDCKCQKRMRHHNRAERQSRNSALPLARVRPHPLQLSYVTPRAFAFGADSNLLAAALPHFHVQALQLLVERAQRNFKVFRSLRLVPVAAFQAVGQDAALDLFHDVE